MIETKSEVGVLFTRQFPHVGDTRLVDSSS